MRIPYGQRTVAGRQYIELKPDGVAAILRTIDEGWAIARRHSAVHQGAGEVVITECLRDGMREALRSLPWGKALAVLPGTESRSRAEVIIPDGRTDIPLYVIEIFFDLLDHDPHAIIECKRVAGSDRRLIREYVAEGIDRFRSGKYGASHSIGFIAGYVIAGDIESAVASINRLLRRTIRAAECLEPFEAVEGQFCYQSRHRREATATHIDLYHSMLLVIGRNPQR